jgi:hypothetical protein
MAYGIEIYNEGGLKVVEFNKTLYVRESDVTRDASTVAAEARALAVAAGHPISPYGEYMPPYSLEIKNLAPFAVDTSGFYTSIISTKVASQNPFAALIDGKAAFGPEMNLDLGDTVFYRADTVGIISQFQIFSDLPGGYPVDKGLAVVNTEGNANVPYVIVSSRLPVATPTEQYGLQMFDDAGTVVFDSRQTLFSIFFAIVVPASVLQGVRNTGVAYDITLPKSVSGAYIACPFYSCYETYEVAGGILYSTLIKQVADDKIRISRVNLGGASTAGTVRRWSQDMPLFVGRPL